VLYGIFPVLAAGMGVAYLRLAWLMRPVDKFRNPPPGIKLKKIHRCDLAWHLASIKASIRLSEGCLHITSCPLHNPHTLNQHELLSSVSLQRCR
jgi:hypothetical protein